MNGFFNIELIMAFYVYILECSDGSSYTGHTDNIEVRIAEHKASKYDSYTSTRLPIKLVFVEDFSSREEALIAERQIKGWNKKKETSINWAQLGCFD